MDQTARPRKRNTSNEFHWNSRESWLTPTRHELSNEITLDARWIASSAGERHERKGEEEERRGGDPLSISPAAEKSRNPSERWKFIDHRPPMTIGDNRCQSRHFSLFKGCRECKKVVSDENQHGRIRKLGNRKWIVRASNIWINVLSD